MLQPAKQTTQILFEKLHPLERVVLPLIKENNTPDRLVLASKLQEVEVTRALQWLENKKIIIIKEELKEVVQLDKNGREYSSIGLPEQRFLTTIQNSQQSADEIKKFAKLNDAEFSVCLGLLKKRNAIEIKKGANLLSIIITKDGKKILENIRKDEAFLKLLTAGERDIISLTLDETESIKELKERKNIINIELKRLKTITLTDIGNELSLMDFSAKITDKLTQDMLKNDSWKSAKFRRFDVEINVPAITGGKRHFENQAIEYVKQIWLDMGFKEMTGNYVHTAYHVLDMLFVPQDHPARAMQDTFYLGEKQVMLGKLPKDYKKIKDIHENGANTNSKGWNYKWDEKEASKIMLRTHTTVLSVLKLQQLKKDELPAKFFNVGKVFRNEALDWKHLFEFYQIDGIVVDPDANFKHLKGYLKEFFGKMGYPDVRIRPAHFPYTEPSVEVDVLHPVKKEWIELGGAGIFRPEVVIPLLGEDIPVLAWGLGTGRIVSSYYNITDIRDMYKNDLKQLRDMKIWLK